MSLCLPALFSFSANAAVDLSSPLELKINLVIVAKGAQSMRELSFDNIELFRNSKVGVTHVNNNHDFNLIYVTPSENSTPELPAYDVSYTFVSNTYNGKNDPLGYYSTGEPHNLLIPTTKDSNVITFKIHEVKLGTPSSKTKLIEGMDTRISLQLQYK